MRLPDGPGLALRWTAAVPMMAVSMFAPWFGQVALSVWWFDDATEPFWDEFDERLSDLGWFPLYLPTIVLAWYLIRRTRMGGWPVACAVVAGLLLVPGMLLSLFGVGWGGLLPNLAFCAGLGLLSWELGRQVVRVLNGAELLVRGGKKAKWRIPVDERTGEALLATIEARAR